MLRSRVVSFAGRSGCSEAVVTVTFRTPWRQLIDMSAPQPDLLRRLFAYEHYTAGHHYYVTRFAVVCECGDSCV